MVNAGSRSRAIPATCTSFSGNAMIASSIAGHRCSWKLLGRDFTSALGAVAICMIDGSDFMWQPLQVSGSS